MKTLMNVAIAVLMTMVIFFGCAGVEQRRLAQANFMNKVAENPKEFKGNYFNLKGFLVVGNKKTTVTHYHGQSPQDAAFQRHQAIRAGIIKP